MLSTFLKPFSDLIRRSSVRLILSSETARSLSFSTSVTFRTICISAENGGYPPTQNGDIRSLFWLFSLMALQN